MSDVNILALGGSGAGKTCFMLGMYDDMRLGYGGFTFSATDVDVDRQLVDRFRILTDGRDEERWPKRTVDPENEGHPFYRYEFSLNYALRRFIVFSWYDYRGGMIAESGEPNQQIRSLTAAADVVMVCAPGDLLYKCHFGRDRNSLRQMLVPEIQQLMEAESDIRPSILILVTKFDEFVALCAAEGPVDDETIETRLLVAVQRQYQTFFARGGKWRVLVCPVSLGPNLAHNPHTAQVEPENMHIPVMYAYHEHARHIAAAWASRIESKSDELDALRKRWFARNRTRVAAEDLDDLRNYHETIQGRLSIVLENLPWPLFFEDGQRAELR